MQILILKQQVHAIKGRGKTGMPMCSRDNSQNGNLRNEKELNDIFKEAIWTK